MKHNFTQERIQETLNTARNFIDGKIRGPLISVWNTANYRQETDHKNLVSKACEVICADGASGNANILPRFLPDLGTCSTAAIWGGERIPASDGVCPHIHTVINSVSELERIKPVLSFEESDFQTAIDLYRKVCDRLETDQVFTTTPDFQGPMNTLALIMDQTELMCAMYSDPDTVKAALDQVTSVLIEYVSRYIKAIGADKIIGNLWPYIIFPAEYGVCITQDYMPLLGPEHYEEFEIPRLKRISDTFGGVFIHCCGEYERHFAALKRSGIKIRGMEQHYPCTKIWNQYEVFGDSMFYVPIVIPNNEYRSMSDFCKSMSERPCAKARFWFSTSGEAFDADLAKLFHPSESERSRTII